MKNLLLAGLLCLAQLSPAWTATAVRSGGRSGWAPAGAQGGVQVPLSFQAQLPPLGGSLTGSLSNAPRLTLSPAVTPESAALTQAKFQQLAAPSAPTPAAAEAAKDTLVSETAGEAPAAAAALSSPKAFGSRMTWMKRAFLALALASGMLGSPFASQAQTLPAQNQSRIVFQMPARGSLMALVQQKQGYVQVSNIQEAIAVSQQGRQDLIVIGDVGLSDAQLQGMAKGLKAKHWTVVLVQDASGQSYRDVDGNSRNGADAVDFGTGQGIGRSGPFQEQKHPLTGQRDGKILTIVMAQRALFYFGSEAQDQQGLGDKAFKGSLDQWAIAALRNNGDIVAAVENTVENIDSRISAAIKSDFARAKADVASAASRIDALETASAAFRKSHPDSPLGRFDIAGLRAQAAKAQAQLDAERPWDASTLSAPVLSTVQAGLAAMQDFEKTQAGAQESIALASQDVNGLEAAAASLKDRFPKTSGTLARPGVQTMREQLQSAQALASKDPAKAAAIAAEVRQIAASLSQEIAQYPAFEDGLRAAEARLSSVSGLERAGSASSELLAAKQALTSSREKWEEGQPGYSHALEAARASLASAEREVASADAAAAAALALLLGLLGLFASLLAGAGFFLRRRVRPVQSEAERFYKDWDARLDEKLEVVYTKLEERVNTFVGPAEGEQKRPHAGATLKLAAATRANVGALNLLWTYANGTLDSARDTIFPKSFWRKVSNYFWPKQYKAAVHKLKDELLAFDAAVGLPELFGKKPVTYKETLYGKPESFTLTFDALINEFNRRAQEADEAIDRIETSLFAFTPTITKTEGLLSEASGTLARGLAEGGASDGLFLVPSLAQSLVPAAKASLAKLQESHKTDPVGAMQGSGADAVRIAQEGRDLAAMIVEARLGSIPRAAKASAALSAAGLSVAWLDAALEKLSGRAEKLASQAASGSIAQKTAELKADLSTLADKAAETVRLTEELGMLTEKTIPNDKTSIAKARAELGASLELAPESTLIEKDANPDDRVAGEGTQAVSARQALSQGDNAAAQAALTEAGRLSSELAAILKASRAAVAAQETLTETRRTKTAEIEGTVPAHETTLAGIVKDFAASVLSLGAGDPSHPSANATVTDNIDEADAHLSSADEKLAKSTSAFRAGRVLEAAGLLAQIAAHQESALHRLSEIDEKKARLDAAISANKTLITALEATSAQYGAQTGGDRRSMQPTLAALKAAQQAVVTGRVGVDARKGDPFKAASILAQAQAALEQVSVAFRNDVDAYNEAERSLKAAASQLNASEVLAGQASNDGIGDSAAIETAYRELRSLSAALKAANAAFGADHGDWNAVDKEADRVTGAAARAAASLKGEMAEAQEAVSDISRAASKVREASNWTGSYGVYIPGSPGSGSLQRARELLQAGRYQEAQREAESASSSAAGAISQAEAEVSRKRREEQERQEAERRERQRREREEEERRNRSSGGSSSSGGGGSSWGGSGSGNGKSGW